MGQCHNSMVKFSKASSFLAICLCWACTIVASDRVVYVNQKNGKDDERCLQPDDNTTACASLGYVASEMGVAIGSHNLSIVIQSNLTLDNVLKFAESTMLHIRAEGGGERRVVLSGNKMASGCGLQFINITNLSISDISISQCEHFLDPKLVNMSRNGSVHVHRTRNLTISNTHISNITGTGLVLSDVGGHCVVEGSEFSDTNAPETIKTNNAFAGGIHAQFSKNKIESPTTLVVRNCCFHNNKQPVKILKVPHIDITTPDIGVMYGHGLGGGASVIFMNSTRGVDVIVEGCNFTRNRGRSGAGLYAHFQDTSTNNSVTVNSSVFECNSAKVGGGMSIGMGKQRVLNGTVLSNKVSINNVTFVGNTANYGGGTAVFALRSIIFNRDSNQLIRFSNCTWTQNVAHYSAAIDVSPFQYERYNQGFLPSPVFEKCDFVQNQMKPGIKDEHTQYRSAGVMVVTTFEVIFNGNNTFVCNKYTALRLTSANVILRGNTSIMFDSNEGLKGGAIAMYGFSALKGRKGSSLTFCNNLASKVGGGIYYQPFEQREFITSAGCFIQYIEHSANNVTPDFNFTFRNNSATLGGSAIYSSSFYSCFYSYIDNRKNHSLTDFFARIGHFDIDDGPENNITALATDGDHFVLQIENNGSLTAIPAKHLNIPLVVKDELNHTVRMPIGMEIQKVRSSNEVRNDTNSHDNYFYFTGNKTRLYGDANDVLRLVFNTQNIRDAYFDFINVTLQDCPPGYHYDRKTSACKCSSEEEATSFQGIPKCNSSLFQAYIQRDFWAGYYHDHDNELYTAPCTFQVCTINSNPGFYQLLPPNSSHDALNRLMCGETKNGILCGECAQEYSAYFHGSGYKCGPKGKCVYSVVFYLLSEIVPVVIIFSLIIHFNVPLTAGGISGFVFFSQMVMIIPHDITMFLNGSNQHVKLFFKSLQAGYTFIYNVLNFDFFSIDELSFCLWRGAKIMDVLAVKYVTTSFTLILIYILVCIMNSRWYIKRNSRKEPRSAVHGLSAFLILAYSQCASVTFKILAHGIIKSTSRMKPLGVTQYGGMPYLGKNHRPYALTAIFFLIFLVLVPPLLLLVYPLTLQLLSLCKLSEHPLTQKVLRTTHVPRLVPLFDSFQSCFKDKLRCFAGIYFVYKILLLMSYTFTIGETAFFATATVTILVILGVHSIAQPYKKRIHNVVDSCLLLNLGIVIGLTAYSSYLLSTEDNYVPNLLLLVCSVKMLLIYTPIIVAIVWYASLFVRRRKRGRRGYENLERVHDISERDDVVNKEETRSLLSLDS